MNNFCKTTLFLAASLILTGCGSGSTTSVLEESSQTMTISSLYDTAPDIASCNEGVLKDEEKQKVLDKVNHIRALHDLPPVSYHYEDDIYTAKSALMSVANAHLEHEPTEQFHCYSEEGYIGSSHSNLFMSIGSIASSEESMVDFLIDGHSESVGHRRWIIDPFLKTISFGRVDGKPIVNSSRDNVTGISLKVINDDYADIEDLAIDYIAYPYKEYPASYIRQDWFMSFSVLADKSDLYRNQYVDFTNSTIEITDENGIALNVHSIGHDNDWYGLPNVLKWKVDGTKKSTTYHVKIQNVQVYDTSKNYTYWFKMTE